MVFVLNAEIGLMMTLKENDPLMPVKIEEISAKEAEVAIINSIKKKYPKLRQASKGP